MCRTAFLAYGVLFAAVQRRDVDLGAECRLGDRQRTSQYRFTPSWREDAVRAHGHKDDRDARGTAVLTFTALSAQSDVPFVVNAGRIVTAGTAVSRSSPVPRHLEQGVLMYRPVPRHFSQVVLTGRTFRPSAEPRRADRIRGSPAGLGGSAGFRAGTAAGGAFMQARG